MNIWMQAFKQNLTPARRLGLGVAAVLIVALTVGLAVWTLRDPDQVLFSNLAPRDASAMTAELDRLKIPYRLDDQGTTILVASQLVHRTRLKLMGHDLPLQGAVGFELFNEADFGMTEFAQKVNYQRALQGELTRTILSLTEIESARVHLVLPEEGVFKREAASAKASITLGLRPGKHLRPDQISGIQRLVAAAVPSIAASEVTLIDQQGVALTTPSGDDAETDTAHSAQSLDLKQRTEQLLARKATQVMERAFGAGQAMASVDVTLNLDRMRVTTEDVLPAPAADGRAPAGVVTHERESLRDAAPLARDASPSDSGAAQRETDYQTGRRVEQIVSQPGAITRLQVVAVVATPLSDAQREQARALLGAAVGALADRGDTVVVQTLAGFTGEAQGSAATAPSIAMPPAPSSIRPQPMPDAHRAPSSRGWSVSTLPASAVAAILGLLFIAALGLGQLRWAQRRAARGQLADPKTQRSSMSQEERQRLLAQLQRWCDTGRVDAS